MKNTFENMKLKINGYRNICNENVIDTFSENTIDNRKINLDITENGNCLFYCALSTDIIGYTNNKNFAFYFLRNIVILATIKELFRSYRVTTKNLFLTKE